LPTLVGLKIVKQKLVALKDDQGFRHLLSFLDLEAIVFVFYSRKGGRFSVNIFFVNFLDFNCLSLSWFRHSSGLRGCRC